MDAHMAYLPLALEDGFRQQRSNQSSSAPYPTQRSVVSSSATTSTGVNSTQSIFPASRTAVPSSAGPSEQQQHLSPPGSQPLPRAHPREQAQYAASSTSSGGSSAPSPPSTTTTNTGIFERRTRRRRSFRGAANKLARKKSSSKVDSIPEDPSSTSGAVASSSASEKSTPRNYQYRAFHQPEISSGLPNSDEYSYQTPPGAPLPPQPQAPTNGEYPYPQSVAHASTSSLSTSSSDPPGRKSRTLAALALGKRAVRQVLGGGGNNPSDAPIQVTYFGRGGAGTRRSGQLPTIRADSFSGQKPPVNGIHPHASSSSLGHSGSIVGSSGYAPSVASAPYTSTQSHSGTSPILTHRSLSPNMFAGSRLSLSSSSYTGTYATSLYEEDIPEGWVPSSNGHVQDPRMLRGSQHDRAFTPTHNEIKEEAEEYDPMLGVNGVGGAPPPVTYNGPSGEVYIIESDYSAYPPQDEKQLQPPQPLYRDYRSPSTAASSSNESTPLVHSNDGLLPLSPSIGLPPPNLANSLLATPVKSPLSDMSFQISPGTPYRRELPTVPTNGDPMASVGVQQPTMDLNTSLQLQALHANLAAATANGSNQLYAQQYALLPNNLALLNNIVASGGMLSQAELTSALAQLSIITAMQQQPVFPNSDQLPPPPTYTPYSQGGAPSFSSQPAVLYPGSEGQSSHAAYPVQPAPHHSTSKDLELAQTIARKHELEKKLLELEIQRLQREQALAPHSYGNSAPPASQNYY